MNIDFLWAILDSKLSNQNLGNGKIGDPKNFLINEFNLNSIERYDYRTTYQQILW